VGRILFPKDTTHNPLVDYPAVHYSVIAIVAVIIIFIWYAKTYTELSSAGFRKLASFIFGRNIANKNIAMTTPVHMDINDSQSSRSFVMPSTYNKDNLPNPNDSSITNKTNSEE